MIAEMDDFGTIHLRGDALMADVNACDLPRGRFALWWLGQHSFIVKLGGAVIYIDPFLSPMEGRQVPPLLTPEQATNASLFVGTHDHADHIDRPVWPALASASPTAPFLVPQCLLDRGLATSLGIAADRFVGMDAGQTWEMPSQRREFSNSEAVISICSSGISNLESEIPSLKSGISNPKSAIRNPQSAIDNLPSPISLTAIASSHEFLDADPATGRFPYLGFVYEGHGCRLYHPGDTVWYEGLQTTLRRWRFDAMLLPINGRDATRLRNNIIGNMTYQEAADLSGPLNPGVVIPTHYDMFAGNPGDPAAFIDYMSVKYPTVRTHRCRYGERLIINSHAA